MATIRQVTRVERTFAFIDISRFTPYTDQRGDAAAVAALADFRMVVRDTASRQGVRVDKWLGDGAMFVSVDPTPLVKAVLAIEQELVDVGFPLPLRAGMASGLVILFEGDDYIGMPVNLASRLCTEAAPGEVLVTDVVAQSAPDWCTTRWMGDLDVRGVMASVAVVALSSRKQPATAGHSDPVSFG
jgi:adenylate cyclase